ncbi:hypothetical protein C8R44DRAFT_984500 [Mycena epipterygia]|nr:hypothetical protein C8R44DRAFT_984500 [Mycena epipterygia]
MCQLCQLLPDEKHFPDESRMPSVDGLVKYGLMLLLPVAYLIHQYYHSSASSPSPLATPEEKPAKSIMQPSRDDLAPPKDDPFTAIAGTVFDVSAKVDVYGAGCSYNIFAGKDGSRGLGMSSLKAEHAVPDYSALTTANRKVLDDWHAFFTYASFHRFLLAMKLTGVPRKRYNIVGRITDLPQHASGKEDAPADVAPNLWEGAIATTHVDISS